MMNTKSLLLTFCAILIYGFISAQPDAATLLNNADASVNKYTKLEYTFLYKERMRNKGIVEGDMDMMVFEGANKLVWTRARKPEKAQLIWGVKDGKVWVNKGLKLQLKPFNNLLMKNSHASNLPGRCFSGPGILSCKRTESGRMMWMKW